MTHNETKNLVFQAWGKLIRAYLVSFAASLAAGYVLIEWIALNPQKIFDLTTKRLVAAGAIFEKGLAFGIDPAMLLFVWNSAGALATISFIYTASLIHPGRTHHFPKRVRKALVGKTPMKALRFLPGCLQIQQEPVRRVYVWLMVPLLGMILLGVECGFIVSSATHLFDSYLMGIMSLAPHGVVEIPAFALAGAVTFSGHLLVKQSAGRIGERAVFDAIKIHREAIPVRLIALFVMLCLLVAGIIEAHTTGKVLAAVFGG